MTLGHVLGTMREEKVKMCEKNSKHHLFGTFWDGFTANRLKSKAKISMLNTGRKTV